MQDTLWAQGTGKGVETWCKANGWEVVSFDAYALGSTDFSPSLIKVRAQKAQVIVTFFDMPQSGILLKQARAMQIPALLAGFISPVAPENAWDVFEKEVEGMVNMQFEIGPVPVKAVPKSVAFNENFGKRWGNDARMKLSGHGPGPSYDSVYILDFFADPELVLHDYFHVLRQWNRGRLSITWYLGECLRRGYRRNRYEHQARRFASLRLPELQARLREARRMPV